MSEKEKESFFEKASPVFVILSIVLAFFVGVLWQKTKSLEGQKVAGTQVEDKGSNQQAQPAQAAVSLETIKGLFDKDVIKFGDKDRKVIFVEISDPSCPFCHIADGYDPELAASVGDRFKYSSKGGSYVPPGPEMEKLVNEGKASYIYIYAPGHGSGELGMEALYCAFEKGKFWEVKNALMTNAGYTLMNETIKNDKGNVARLADFLKGVIDSEFLKSCISSGKYDQRLKTDAQLARGSLNFEGTPDFYVNDVNFAGAYGWDQMKPTVDKALQ